MQVCLQQWAPGSCHNNNNIYILEWCGSDGIEVDFTLLVWYYWGNILLKKTNLLFLCTLKITERYSDSMENRCMHKAVGAFWMCGGGGCAVWRHGLALWHDGNAKGEKGNNNNDLVETWLAKLRCFLGIGLVQWWINIFSVLLLLLLLLPSYYHSFFTGHVLHSAPVVMAYVVCMFFC